MRMPIANEKREIPWCAPSIRVDLRGDSLPNQIIKSRNRALLALCIQFAATIAGFMFYFFRRVIFQLHHMSYISESSLSSRQYDLSVDAMLRCNWSLACEKMVDCLSWSGKSIALCYSFKSISDDLSGPWSVFLLFHSGSII